MQAVIIVLLIASLAIVSECAKPWTTHVGEALIDFELIQLFILRDHDAVRATRMCNTNCFDALVTASVLVASNDFVVCREIATLLITNEIDKSRFCCSSRSRRFVPLDLVALCDTSVKYVHKWHAVSQTCDQLVRAMKNNNSENGEKKTRFSIKTPLNWQRAECVCSRGASQVWRWWCVAGCVPLPSICNN